MIQLVIAVLLAISTHTACDMGKPIDYYVWVETHPDYHVPMTLSTPDAGDYWLMETGGNYYLFKFAQPIDSTIASGASHGECFRSLN